MDPVDDREQEEKKSREIQHFELIKIEMSTIFFQGRIMMNYQVLWLLIMMVNAFPFIQIVVLFATVSSSTSEKY